MLVCLDADGAIIGEGHAEDWIIGPAPVEQGDRDSVFGNRRVIGDGDFARLGCVGQSADWTSRKLPRGGGRGEEQ